MIQVTLYTRKECHLCEQAKADLDALQAAIPHELTEVDIESDPALLKTYALEIPVAKIGPYRIKAPFSRQELEITLRAAADSRSQVARVKGKPVPGAMEITSADRVSYWLTKHYLLIFNLFLFLYVGIPFLAPVFKQVGWDGAANVVYKMYRPLCHQWGFRSFFLFGEQLVYPHEEANLAGLLTFEEVTGITDQNDPSRSLAREYEGDPVVGYKIAMCERDIAIWGSLLVFGLLFAVSGRRIPMLNWVLLTGIGLLPIALDGFSQLLSQIPLKSTFFQSLLPYRESTPLLRIITGVIFGVCMAWLLFTNVEASMAESRKELDQKFGHRKNHPR